MGLIRRSLILPRSILCADKLHVTLVLAVYESRLQCSSQGYNVGRECCTYQDICRNKKGRSADLQRFLVQGTDLGLVALPRACVLNSVCLAFIECDIESVPLFRQLLSRVYCRAVSLIDQISFRGSGLVMRSTISRGSC